MSPVSATTPIVGPGDDQSITGIWLIDTTGIDDLASIGLEEDTLKQKISQYGVDEARPSRSVPPAAQYSALNSPYARPALAAYSACAARTGCDVTASSTTITTELPPCTSRFSALISWSSGFVVESDVAERARPAVTPQLRDPDEWILTAIRTARVDHPAMRELKQERRADRRREVARPSSWSLDAARRPRARTRIDAARASAATHAPRPVTGRLRSAPASITPETYQTNISNRVVILCETEPRATANKCRCKLPFVSDKVVL
ncbi:hypothetical protein MSG28_011167 [Choristoneura fumiferana]|uniref:Uncharacterized protein n=1 Tax=Choristoneura fumiferana TaxID=7141 RepID=A0ACC0KQG9_CHOFU|nr:hypothetical protein MSG28_011167 [Choristoneura fumiferana]